MSRGFGFESVANTPRQFDAWLKAEHPRWAKVIADAKVQKAQ